MGINNQPHKCPVCGEHEFSYPDSGEICPVCGWADSYVQEHYPDLTGDNLITLIEAKRRFAKHHTIEAKGK